MALFQSKKICNDPAVTSLYLNGHLPLIVGTLESEVLALRNRSAMRIY